MTSGGIHYEIFCRKGKGGWSLHAALPNRDAALKEARTLLPAGAATGVRVFKETFNPETGDFQTLKVFEEGDVAEKKAKTSAEGTSLPCFKPEDFYSFHGRRTIARLLRESLSRWRITVTELLHHAGHIERLELTGTVLQHAIQKAAVKHAGATGDPVQQVVKQLNELVSRATERVIMDGRKERFPSMAKEGFGPLCARYAESGGDYYVNAAIAYHLEDTETWGEKLDRVLALLGDLPAEDGPARSLGLKLIDSIVGEMLTGNAALGDLLGEMPDLGSALVKMADIFLGRVDPQADDPPGLKALCREFAKGNLVNARTAIAQRVLQEIQGVRRLKPDSLDEEVKLMRMLATRMVMGQGSMITQEEILDAFTARSKHLVTAGTIDHYLEGSIKPEDKIEKLLVLEENIIGTANKRSLVSFVMSVLTATRTEAYFVESNEPPQARLVLLGKLSLRLQKAGFQDLNKRQLAERIDAMAVLIERKSGFLESMMKSAKTPLEALERILPLITNQILPEGSLVETLRTRMRDVMRTPAFKAQLSDAPQARVSALAELITKAGLEPTGGKADAA